MMRLFLLLLTLLTAHHALAQTEREVTIVQHNGEEVDGYIKIRGEVKNTYSNALASVRIEIEYLDKTGKPLGVERFTAKDAGVMAKDEVMASRDVIPPGEISPFERTRDIGKLKGQFGSYKIKASGLLLKENLTSATISDVKTTPDGKGFRVTGTYQATGKEPCKNPTVIVAGYDASGKLQELQTLSLTDDGTYKGKPLSEVAPGKTQPFSLLLPNTSGKVTSVKVFASHSWY